MRVLFWREKKHPFVETFLGWRDSGDLKANITDEKLKYEIGSDHSTSSCLVQEIIKYSSINFIPTYS